MNKNSKNTRFFILNDCEKQQFDLNGKQELTQVTNSSNHLDSKSLLLSV